jgi:hypothetical protein
MSINARTLPAHEALLSGKPLPTSVDGERAISNDRTITATATLAVIVALSALIVVMAADRPSFLSATTHSHYFPGWMAGPLGGLWPGLTRNNTILKYLFSGSIIVMYISYVLGLRHAAHLRVRTAVAAIVAVHVIFFLAPPMALTDIFNYVNYGRMEVVHHLNPYTTIPILEPHDDPSFALSNWHHLFSPYGPLFTLLSFAIVPLGVAASFWAFKAILLAASLGTLTLIFKCAKLLGRDPVQAILFVGLNPVVLVWGLGGDHNDFTMIFCIALGFYLLLRSRVSGRDPGDPSPASYSGEPRASAEAHANGQVGLRLRGPGRSRALRAALLAPSPLDLAAGAAFVSATAFKASAGILIPVVLAALLRDSRRLVQVLGGMAIAGVLIGAASLLAFGAHLPDLSTQGSLVTPVSIPNLIGLALGQGGETNTLRQVLSVALVLTEIGCCVLAYRRRELLTASGWATVGLLVTLSWVLPWYVVWVLPVAALSSSRRLRKVTLLLGAYLIIVWVPISSALFEAVGFNPSKTSLGKQHQRIVKQLLD